MEHMENAAANVPEAQLKQEVSTIKVQIDEIVITNNDDYEKAVELGRAIKTRTAEVKGFFKPMKEAANKAHKEICGREKALLTPLEDAEKQLKKAIGVYVAELEQKRIEEERKLRLAAQQEAQKALEAAIQAEENGDSSDSEAAMMEAQMMESFANTVTVSGNKPDVKGVLTTVDWEIESIDNKVVPDFFAGAEIRPVDEKAIMRLIRATKGTIEIPGVKYTKTQKVSLRRN